MIHNEHFLRADDLYEIRHDNNGNAIHVYVKDGDAIVFPTAYDLFAYVVQGKPTTERFYIAEAELSAMYTSEHYNYYHLKNEYDSGVELRVNLKPIDTTKFHRPDFALWMARNFNEGNAITYKIVYDSYERVYTLEIIYDNETASEHLYMTETEARNDVNEAVKQLGLVLKK